MGLDRRARKSLEFGTAFGSREFDSLRNGNNTRTAILDAAENLFAAASFDIVSMRDVAAKAKVPLGLINYHFQSKEKLFEELKRVVGYRPEEIELMPKLAQLEIPALIVHSKDDAMVRFITGQKWAASWPGAQLLALEKLGHRRLLFDPSTAGLISDFLVQRSTVVPEVKVA